jgi:hypothetical protein
MGFSNRENFSQKDMGFAHRKKFNQKKEEVLPIEKV